MSDPTGASAASAGQQKARPVLALECPRAGQISHAQISDALCQALEAHLMQKLPGYIPRRFEDLAEAPRRPGDLAVRLALLSASQTHLAARLDWRRDGAARLQPGEELHMTVTDSTLSGAMLERFVADLLRANPGLAGPS